MKDIKTVISEYYGELIEAEMTAAAEAAEREPIRPSKRFEKRMSKLLGTEAAESKTRSGKCGKRILIFAIAALIALAAAACSAPKVRESIAGFFVKVFGDHVEYSEPAISKESIEEEYGLIPVPKGFEVESTEKLDGYYSIAYRNSSQIVILFIQSAKGFEGESLDIERCEILNRSIGEKNVRILLSDNYAQASWIFDGYYFSLTYAAPIDIVSFEALIDSVQSK